MPSYTVVTPQFNPIDFAERIAPMEQYAKAYNAQEEALSEAGILADTVGSLINREKDSELYKTYESFSNEITNTVDNLSSSGDISSTRNALRDLRRRYASDIQPIQTGYAAWQQAIADYDKMLTTNPTYLGVDPRSYSISDYMRGNSPKDYSVSGELLYSTANADAKAASSRRVLINDWGLDPALLGQYFSKEMATGYSANEVGEILLRDLTAASKASPEKKEQLGEAIRYMANAYNRIADTYGIDAFGRGTYNYNRAGNYIMQGLLSGMTYDYNEKNLANGSASGSGGADGYSEAPLPFRPTEVVDARNAKDIAPLQKDADFVASIYANPQLLAETNELSEEDKKKVHSASGLTRPGMVWGNIAIPDTNIERFEKIAKRYGYEGGLFTEVDGKYEVNDDAIMFIQDAINSQIENNVKINNVLTSNVTDESGMVDYINQTMLANKGINAFEVRGKGRKGKEVASIPAGGTFSLDVTQPGNYFTYTALDDRGRKKEYLVPAEAVNAETLMYVNLAKELNKAGDTEGAMRYMELAFSQLYTAANGKAKIQTKTDSKLGGE